MKSFRAITTLLLLLLAVSAISAQADFPYTLRLTPYPITDLDGIHSFAHAQHGGHWLLLGGRRDGLHARQPFNAFPLAHNNTTIQVVEPATKTVWTADVAALPTSIREQMQATNMQYFQDGDQLIVVGGYAFSPSANDHITFPYLTVVDIPGLVDAIKAGQPINDYFQQITNDAMAVTGGVLGKIGDTYYLVGGHRFDGRYNPMGHATYVQTYTDAIRTFTLDTDGAAPVIGDYTTISDPVHLHRRDYNLLPQVYPDGSLGYTMFSGVFQINQDLPFLYPIDVTAEGYQPVTDFNQYLANYHSAHVPLYDAGQNAMHNLFFGGISQYYYVDGVLIQDNNVPFVKTISRVSRSADGTLLEAVLPLEMPGYLGASAEFLMNETLSVTPNGIIELAEVAADSFVIGYVVGGLDSPDRNPFSVNNTGVTSAATTVFQVSLVKNASTPTTAVAGGYHGFTFTASPNPSRGGLVKITAQLPEAGTLDIFLMDTLGRIVLNRQEQTLTDGKTRLSLPVDNPTAGLHTITMVLNGRYVASSKIIFE